jgi:hypothetical protein
MLQKMKMGYDVFLGFLDSGAFALIKVRSEGQVCGFIIITGDNNQVGYAECGLLDVNVIPSGQMVPSRVIIKIDLMEAFNNG